MSLKVKYPQNSEEEFQVMIFSSASKQRITKSEKATKLLKLAENIYLPHHNF